MVAHFDEFPFLPNETPEQFTERILAACNFIWTIRSLAHPEVCIGECALHHWNQETKSIQIGGSLLPDYWGQGLMQAAFLLLMEVANNLGVKVMVGLTQTNNLKAIRLVEKMGFEQVEVENGVVRLEKVLHER